MIDNTSYLLAKQHVKAGETVKVWSNLLVDSIFITAPALPKGTVYSLYEIVTDENRHGGWFWEREKETE